MLHVLSYNEIWKMEFQEISFETMNRIWLSEESGLVVG